jgi:hypothetical protein
MFGPMGPGMDMADPVAGPARYGPTPRARGSRRTAADRRIVWVDLGLMLSLDNWVLPDGRRIVIAGEVRQQQPDWLKWEESPEIKIASARFRNTVPAGKALLLRMPLIHAQRQQLTHFRRETTDGEEKTLAVRGHLRDDPKAILEGYIYAFIQPKLGKP